MAAMISNTKATVGRHNLKRERERERKNEREKGETDTDIAREWKKEGGGTKA